MNWWEYLILVNVYLVLFFGFYALLLKRETFFQLNRLYLVSAALLSFLMPLIQSNWIKSLFITQTMHATIYGSPVIAYQFKAVADTPMTIGEMLAVTYLVGVGLLIIRFGWQLISLRRVINRPDANAPYAFFNKVQVDNELSENEIIATHEQVHARQLHSADVLIIEAVMIVNWFNPVVYFYRFAIKHIHEFIADSYTLRNGTTDKADYAMLLLSQTFNTPQHQLVSNFFNRSLLKQRIVMLQKNRSARIKMVKYGLSAPLFALMLVLSAATVNTSSAVTKVNVFANRILALPASKVTTFRLRPVPDSVKKDAASAKKIAMADIRIDSAVKNEIVMARLKAKSSLTINEVKTTDTVPGESNIVFSAVEKEPHFPGNFGTFLAQNIRYPAVDRENNVQGKVFIQFIVEQDGSLSNFKVLRTPSQTLGDEAVRVLNMSPKWTPGTQNGRTVRVMFTVPISFTLTPDDNSKAKMLNSVEVTSYVKDTAKQTGKLTLTEHKPLYTAGALVIIDGKEKTYDDFKLMDVSTIKSINVLNKENAVKFYGDKGKFGAIVISTKK